MKLNSSFPSLFFVLTSSFIDSVTTDMGGMRSTVKGSHGWSSNSELTCSMVNTWIFWSTKGSCASAKYRRGVAKLSSQRQRSLSIDLWMSVWSSLSVFMTSLSSLPRKITLGFGLGNLHSFLVRFDRNDLPFSFREEHDLTERLGFDRFLLFLGWLCLASQAALRACFSALLSFASCPFRFFTCGASRPWLFSL